MRKHVFGSRSTWLFVSLFLAAPLVHATTPQAFRVYLASTGADTNPCTLHSPCRWLPAALAAVLDGGEVLMLDSANYNTTPVAIDNMSVTIMAAPGVSATLVGNNGNAINKTGFGTVKFRSVSFSSISGSTNIGINVTGDIFDLVLEDTEFTGFSTAVSIVDSTNSGQGTLHAYRTSFFNNDKAITIAPTPDVTDGIRVLIDHCTIENTIGWSIYATRATVVVTNSNITSGNYGIDADTGSEFWLSNVVISDQYDGVYMTGGTVRTFGDNVNAANRFGNIAGGSVTATTKF